MANKKINKTLTHTLKKDLLEKIIALLEDEIDAKAIRETNFKEGEDFEKITAELGI